MQQALLSASQEHAVAGRGRDAGRAGFTVLVALGGDFGA